jgi:mannose-6-phosphate isomerase-like protein (cupin superfamily)
MIDPMILFNIDAPVEIYGAEGGSGSLLWKRLAGGVDLCGDWESFEYARLQPGGSIGEHVHHRTEEIYFVTGGRAVMHMDDTASEIGPGDLIMTPIDGRHSAETIDGEGLEFIVAEVLPPDSLFPDRPRPPGWHRVPAGETPIVNLKDGEPLDPSPYFNGPWKSIERRSVQPGSDLELSADDVEHAFYVIGGTGRATSATRDVELKAGGGMALPKGGGVSIHADDEPLDVFLVTVAL